jgi:hypothetical protein
MMVLVVNPAGNIWQIYTHKIDGLHHKQQS